MKEIDVMSFFTDSKSVWTSENFQNLILGKYSDTGDDQADKAFKSSNLQDLHSDIDAQKIVFKNVDTFLRQLASLIRDQIDGGSGKLLNDSSANYFFVKGKDEKLYSILVRWEHAQKLWRCGAYLQEELKLPNIRIFYPS